MEASNTYAKEDIIPFNCNAVQIMHLHPVKMTTATTTTMTSSTFQPLASKGKGESEREEPRRKWWRRNIQDAIGSNNRRHHSQQWQTTTIGINFVYIFFNFERAHIVQVQLIFVFRRVKSATATRCCEYRSETFAKHLISHLYFNSIYSIFEWES